MSRWPSMVTDLPRGFGDLSKQRWWIYVHEDAAGTPLYVGFTANPRDRMKQHVSNSPWWSEVASISLHGPWDDRDEAREVERQTIRELDPPHNVVHTDRNHRPLTVAEARERVRVAELALGIAREALAAAEHRELVDGAA